MIRPSMIRQAESDNAGAATGGRLVMIVGCSPGKRIGGVEEDETSDERTSAATVESVGG